MKKIFGFMLLLAIAGGSVFAQTQRNVNAPKGQQGMRHGKKHNALKGVNLSDAQKAQLKANKEAHQAKMAELNKQDNLTVKEMRERKTALQQEQKDKMQALLTPEQKKQVADNRAGMQAKQKGMQANNAAKMKEQLNLTDAQAAKLKSHQEATQAKMKAIQDNDKLTPAEKKEQRKALAASSHKERDQILTAEQQQKMQELQKDNQGKRRNNNGRKNDNSRK